MLDDLEAEHDVELSEALAEIVARRRSLEAQMRGCVRAGQGDAGERGIDSQDVVRAPGQHSGRGAVATTELEEPPWSRRVGLEHVADLGPQVGARAARRVVSVRVLDVHASSLRLVLAIVGPLARRARVMLGSPGSGRAALARGQREV